MLDGMPPTPTNTTPASPIGPNITLDGIAWRFNGGGTFAGGNRDIEPPHPPLAWSRTGPWPSYVVVVRGQAARTRARARTHARTHARKHARS